MVEAICSRRIKSFDSIEAGPFEDLNPEMVETFRLMLKEKGYTLWQGNEEHAPKIVMIARTGYRRGL
ncbi:hypothetical protein A3H83_03260 [Candidatus Roizmanbacteria bacterium RIFCSPLOWO2_02_FULL_39_8]|uniref:Uncharacterized protein n=1 Tax=Candidatus Roizmanbacteria bacterium RIFCSPHIGHO2_01_FULL_39_24 TaxID=1802032 RepID=A0A1F7GFI3_9BACT|nr:MAG: hypothetical protein A2799_02785 [Candidatus Roizmanbacteria bacterium RIFCSPHIGHO2_01_FULL_39_24]OGK57450.1 MAG: hypothetical protein A3H83_03260 [Candidatus Roizmanbacteria bacterium RIFCSPLOWO2_02_FULL_39_8]